MNFTKLGKLAANIVAVVVVTVVLVIGLSLAAKLIIFIWTGSW